MIIGIEARSASHPQKGGYKTYVQNLLAALAELETAHTYHIYPERETEEWHPPLLRSGQTSVVRNRLPVIHHPVREQIQLPWRAWRDGCSFLHYTANSGSLYSPIPYVVTLHDVIALTEAQARFSLARSRLRQWIIALYERSIIPVAAKRSAAVITVSQFERSQICEVLGVPADKVFVTHLAASKLFRHLLEPEAAAARQRVEASYAIAPGFLLAVGYEPRKNVDLTIDAYCRLEESLRRDHALVIVCARQHVREKLLMRVEQERLATVRILPAVGPVELLELYNCAAALVFPSRRESFGLPPLEAMACGTPVIAADSSSMPEILEDAALYVPTDDMIALSQAMSRLLSSLDMRLAFRDRGFTRSHMFSWEKTARATLAVYDELGRRVAEPKIASRWLGRSDRNSDAG